MSNKIINPVKCVHCQKLTYSPTKDHIFPVSWYPDSTPKNLRKWSVPSCATCNTQYGRIEEDLLTRFALCLDPKAEASKGIYERVNRSINADAARNDKEANIRKGKFIKLQKDFMITNDLNHIPTDRLLPGFGMLQGVEYNGIITVEIPRHLIHALVLKICKGLTLKCEGIYLDLDNKHQIMYLPKDQEKQFDDGFTDKTINTKGTTYSWGPGLLVKRAALGDGSARSITYIELWQRLKLYILVMKKTTQ